MIRTIDPNQLGIPTLILPPGIGGTPSRPSEAPACRRCVEFSPGPRLDGTLLVDPEIHLPSPGMDVDIAYFYNGNSTYNGPYGYGRTISPNLLAVASGVNAIVTLQRGDGSLVSFQDDGSGTFVAKTPGLLNSLVKDTTNSYWKESTLDGQTLAYPLNTSGMVTSIAYQEDASGNRHSFVYSSGRLETLQDAVGGRASVAISKSSVIRCRLPCDKVLLARIPRLRPRSLQSGAG